MEVTSVSLKAGFTLILPMQAINLFVTHLSDQVMHDSIISGTELYACAVNYVVVSIVQP